MSKELDRIYPNSNTGAIKGSKRHINGVGRGRGGCSGDSGRGGVRGNVRPRRRLWHPYD